MMRRRSGDDVEDRSSDGEVGGKCGLCARVLANASVRQCAERDRDRLPTLSTPCVTTCQLTMPEPAMVVVTVDSITLMISMPSNRGQFNVTPRFGLGRSVLPMSRRHVLKYQSTTLESSRNIARMKVVANVRTMLSLT